MTCDWLEHHAMLDASPSAVDAHLAHCEHCRAELQRYGKIAALIARGATSHRAPADWKHRTLARVRAAQRVRKRRISAISLLAGATAALVAVLVIHAPPEPPRDGDAVAAHSATNPNAVAAADSPGARDPGNSVAAADVDPQLTIEIHARGSKRGASRLPEHAASDSFGRVGPSHTRVASAHDELRASAALHGATHFAIRVYRSDGQFMAGCSDTGAPREPVCGGSDRRELIWVIPAEGDYQVRLLVSPPAVPVAIPPPSESLDRDEATAVAAGVHIGDLETLHVD